MGQRIFYTDSKMSEAGIEVVCVKITGAADVGVNGYTVSEGGKCVSAVTRTGEGVFKVFLNDAYSSFINAIALCSCADTIVAFTAEDVDSTSAPYVQLTAVTAGSAADPDGGVIYLTLFLQRAYTLGWANK